MLYSFLGRVVGSINLLPNLKSQLQTFKIGKHPGANPRRKTLPPDVFFHGENVQRFKTEAGRAEWDRNGMLMTTKVPFLRIEVYFNVLSARDTLGFLVMKTKRLDSSESPYNCFETTWSTLKELVSCGWDLIKSQYREVTETTEIIPWNTSYETYHLFLVGWVIWNSFFINCTVSLV